MRRAGGDGELVALREFGNQTVQPLENGAMLAQVTEKVVQLSSVQVFQVVLQSGLLEESAQGGVVGESHMLGEDNAVIVFPAELREQIFKRLLVQRLAVNNDPVEIEDDRGEFLHAR